MRHMFDSGVASMKNLISHPESVCCNENVYYFCSLVRELCYTSRKFNSEEAKSFGLVRLVQYEAKTYGIKMNPRPSKYTETTLFNL